MITEKQLVALGNKYLSELKAIGRKFYPVKFEFKNRKSAKVFGTAYYSYERCGYDRITLNKHFASMDDLINTLLHEIAHLDHEARGHGHGPRWKKVASIYGNMYNTNITRTSKKQIAVPGQVIVQVVWSEACLRINKTLPKVYSRKYSSRKYAENFIKKYERIGFLESYNIVKV